jgi:hypothetical protein
VPTDDGDGDDDGIKRSHGHMDADIDEHREMEIVVEEVGLMVDLRE